MSSEVPSWPKRNLIPRKAPTVHTPHPLGYGQGVQPALLGSEYDQRDLYETHNKIVSKIFKGMLI